MGFFIIIMKKAKLHDFVLLHAEIEEKLENLCIALK